jgi:hypothetical protein
MKIAYKILWVEDNFNQIEPFINQLETLFGGHGFKLDVIKRTSLTQGEIESLRDQLNVYNPYDMMMFDFDLGAGELKGSKLAKELRANVYTDMIVYSGSPVTDVRRALYDEKVDGVFIVQRTSFVEEVWLIFEDNIRKICDTECAVPFSMR